LNSPDESGFASLLAPGCAAADAPVMIDDRRTWLLEALRGGFHGLYFSHDIGDTALAELAAANIRTLIVAAADGIVPTGTPYVIDADGLVAKRYDARPGTFYLLRPDQHVAGRWRRLDPDIIVAAFRRATATL
jgi:3-(3-hydroxy-phenyl)propionate hydroxylase